LRTRRARRRNEESTCGCALLLCPSGRLIVRQDGFAALVCLSRNFEWPSSLGPQASRCCRFRMPPAGGAYAGLTQLHRWQHATEYVGGQAIAEKRKVWAAVESPGTKKATWPGPILWPLAGIGSRQQVRSDGNLVPHEPRGKHSRAPGLIGRRTLTGRTCAEGMWKGSVSGTGRRAQTGAGRHCSRAARSVFVTRAHAAQGWRDDRPGRGGDMIGGCRDGD